MVPCLVLAGLLILQTAAPIAVDDGPVKPVPFVLDEAARAKLLEIAFQAAREGDLETLAAYLAQPSLPVNEVNQRGDTLLILAAYHEHEKAVEVILARPDVKVDAVNRMGLTALTGAAFKGHIAILGRLLKAGANPNQANSRGQTPLMYAAMFGRVGAAKALLKAGADPSASDAERRTALDLATQQGSDTMMVMLREAAEKVGKVSTTTPK